MKVTAIAILVNDVTELPPVRLYGKTPHRAAIVPVNFVDRTGTHLNL